MREQTILRQMLPEMVQIINAIPGEAYSNKEAETLLIMQHRLPESELKKQLESYNSIFAKQGGADIEDITKSSVAYVKLKILLEAELTEFDAKSYRDLIKECKANIDKTTNILRLSKTHMLTADDYQKERIEKIAKKNEAFIEALQTVISYVEQKIERYKSQHQLMDIEHDVQFYVEQMKELQTRLIELQAQMNVIDMMDAYVKDPANKYNIVPSLLNAQDG